MSQERKRPSIPMGERRWPCNINNAPVQFFEERVQHELNTGCWLWSGATHSDGYGYVRLKGRRTGAHRFSLILAGVKLTDADVVLHKCDTPACVNPAHLAVGTHLENVADMVTKGRNRIGPLHSIRAKPSEALAALAVSKPGLKKFCKYGHEFSTENTCISIHGFRRCRACNNARSLASYIAKKTRLKK